MATITAWAPVGEPIALRDAINQLFESSVLQPRRAGATNGNGGQASGDKHALGRGLSRHVEEA